MDVFDKLRLDKFRIVYTMYGNKSEMRFESSMVGSEGEMPISAWPYKKKREFRFKMSSDATNPATHI